MPAFFGKLAGEATQNCSRRAWVLFGFVEGFLSRGTLLTHNNMPHFTSHQIDKTLYLGFGNTRLDHLKDWKADLDAFPASHDDGEMHAGSFVFLMSFLPTRHLNLINSGILRLARKLVPANVIAVARAQQCSRIVLCGHSQGGGVATLAAVDLQEHLQTIPQGEHDVDANLSIEVVALGSPLVMDRRARDAHAGMSNRIVHIVLPGDPIPFLLRLLPAAASAELSQEMREFEKDLYQSYKWRGLGSVVRAPIVFHLAPNTEWAPFGRFLIPEDRRLTPINANQYFGAIYARIQELSLQTVQFPAGFSALLTTLLLTSSPCSHCQHSLENYVEAVSLALPAACRLNVALDRGLQRIMVRRSLRFSSLVLLPSFVSSCPVHGIGTKKPSWGQGVHPRATPSPLPSSSLPTSCPNSILLANDPFSQTSTLAHPTSFWPESPTAWTPQRTPSRRGWPECSLPSFWHSLHSLALFATAWTTGWRECSLPSSWHSPHSLALFATRPPGCSPSSTSRPPGCSPSSTPRPPGCSPSSSSSPGRFASSGASPSRFAPSSAFSD